MKFKKTILVDLDGVLNTYTGNYSEEIPKVKDGVDLFLAELQKTFKVVIHTTRDKNKVLEWLRKNNLDKYISHVTNIKEPAYLILDDRCVTFNGDFSEALEQIKNFKVWYK